MSPQSTNDTATISPSATSSFLFVTCQVGAETAVKEELARCWPALRVAYARRAFLTFKLPAAAALASEIHLPSVFARSYGYSQGKVGGCTVEERARKVWELAPEEPFDRLHVWQRDTRPPRDRAGDRAPPPWVAEARDAIYLARPNDRLAHDPASGAVARAGERVLDCILVTQDEWWVGSHRAGGLYSRWPGGRCEIELPPEAVSRAYLKTEEALLWSGLPLRAGDRCFELGAAPGGAAQALLKRGLRVTAVDPAEIHPAVLAHPRFVHIRKRAKDVRRREFRGARWLVADMNVAPNYTLASVESIVTRSDCEVRGMLLTLKLTDWSLAARVDSYLGRVASWGYQARARQLYHNRQEICVAATRRRRATR